MDLQSIVGKRILIAPLNWGLGHATRSAALIKKLEEKNSISIASDGHALSLLRIEFPHLDHYELPLLKMRYSNYFGALGGVIFRLRHFLRSIQKDHQALQKIISTNGFDLIISDNRYGIYNEGIHSILISHQLRIDAPFSGFLDLPMQNFIEKFDEIWIPDTEERIGSGLLSKPRFSTNVPIKFIGFLSRFSLKEKSQKEYKFTLIASGLEPFRTQLIDYFYDNFALLNTKSCIVGGGRIAKEKNFKHIDIFEMLDSAALEQVIDRSEYIICRAGYSSIMDLLTKQQQAVLIPTPHQPEQEYLAKLHSDNSLFSCVLKAQDLPSIMNELR